MRGGLAAPNVREGAGLRFRHRARLAVRGRSENPKIGIFEAGSHRVVHIPNCQVHHPLINDVARSLRRVMVDQRVAPYSDAAHRGSVRYLQLVVERSSQSVQLVVVTRESDPEAFSGFFAALASALGPKLHSLWWNGQPEQSNAVLGPLWKHLQGPESVSESVGGARVHYPPGAFGQSNLPLAERMVERVGSFVEPGARVAEYYAGVGALSLPLAARSAALHLNELGAGSLRGMELGLNELAPEQRQKVRVHAGPAAQFSSLVSEVDVVLADPPRRGLDAELLSALLATPPQRLIYLSCGLPALLRESELLLASGKYELRALEAFALFPYTEHVETLAVFDAKRAGATDSSPAT